MSEEQQPKKDADKELSELLDSKYFLQILTLSI